MTLENAATSSRIHMAIDTPSIIPTVFAYIPPLAAGGGIKCSDLTTRRYLLSLGAEYTDRTENRRKRGKGEAE